MGDQKIKIAGAICGSLICENRIKPQPDGSVDVRNVVEILKQDPDQLYAFPIESGIIDRWVRDGGLTDLNHKLLKVSVFERSGFKYIAVIGPGKYWFSTPCSSNVVELRCNE